MERKYLSDAEVLDVQNLLDTFLGLHLTDVWYLYGQYFEFGEQKAFINNYGEKAQRSDFSIKAMNGYEITGLKCGTLSSRDFWLESGDGVLMGGELFQLIEKQELVVQSLIVDQIGSISIDLNRGIQIHVIGMCDEQADDIWMILSGVRTCFYHGEGLLM
ncbi:MAG: hypothetical protein ACKVQS_13715 [Fimbriimonadaceae bacterium]